MSHDSVPTVNIWTANGVVRINESDFNPEIHTRAAEDGNGEIAPVVTPAAPVVEFTNENLQPVPTPGTTESNNDGQKSTEAVALPKMLVTKTGKKFVVVDESGAAVTLAGIDADGYKSEGEAWAAVTALALANNA